MCEYTAHIYAFKRRQSHSLAQKTTSRTRDSKRQRSVMHLPSALLALSQFQSLHRKWYQGSEQFEVCPTRLPVWRGPECTSDSCFHHSSGRRVFSVSEGSESKMKRDNQETSIILLTNIRCPENKRLEQFTFPTLVLCYKSKRCFKPEKSVLQVN